MKRELSAVSSQLRIKDRVSLEISLLRLMAESWRLTARIEH